MSGPKLAYASLPIYVSGLSPLWNAPRIPLLRDVVETI